MPVSIGQPPAKSTNVTLPEGEKGPSESKAHLNGRTMKESIKCTHHEASAKLVKMDAGSYFFYLPPPAPPVEGTVYYALKSGTKTIHRIPICQMDPPYLKYIVESPFNNEFALICQDIRGVEKQVSAWAVQAKGWPNPVESDEEGSYSF